TPGLGPAARRLDRLSAAPWTRVDRRVRRPPGRARGRAAASGLGLRASRQPLPARLRPGGPARGAGRPRALPGGRLMAEWIYFIHAPREEFAATMTDEEKAVWEVHFERFQRALADGTVILVGPTLGKINTGICIFEAPDE